jgi:hypothetical protein
MPALSGITAIRSVNNVLPKTTLFWWIGPTARRSS